MAENDTSESYTAITRRGRASVHCEALTGKLAIGGRCWGEVELLEQRLLGRAVARCQGHAGPTYKPEPGSRDAALRRRLAMVERGLAAIGWSVLDLDVDLTSKTGRAEFRSLEGRVLTVRAFAGGSTWMTREQEREVHLRDSRLATNTTRDYLGKSQVSDFVTGMREAVAYMTDNRPAAFGSGALTGRTRQLARGAQGVLVHAVRELSPTVQPGEPRRSAECTPMTEEWIAECERVCCQGDGWDPYIPSVTSGDCRDRRWVATSGLIVDGRGVHREGTYARGPLL